MNQLECSYIDKSCSHAVTKDGSPHSDESIKALIYSNFQRLQGQLTCDEPGCDEQIREHLWFCLSCGQIFCGEDRQKHTNQHFQNTNSTHSLYLNLKSYLVWCYQCNVYVEASRNANTLTLQLLCTDSRRFKRWNKDAVYDHVVGRNQASDGQANQQPRQQAFTSLQNLFIDLQGAQRAVQERCGEAPLQNFASTCYLNAVLQCLSHSSWFGKYFVALLPYLLLQPLNFLGTYRPLQSNIKELQTYVGSSLSQGTLNGVANDAGIAQGSSGSAKLYLKHLLTSHVTQAIFALQIPQTSIPNYNNAQANSGIEHQQALNVSGLFWALQAVDSTYLGATQQDANEFQTRILDVLAEIFTLKFGGVHTAHVHNIIVENSMLSNVVQTKNSQNSQKDTNIGAATLLSPTRNQSGSQSNQIDAFSYIPASKPEYYKDFVSHVFQGTKVIIEDLYCSNCNFSRQTRREETFSDMHLCLAGSIQDSIDQYGRLHGVETVDADCENCGHRFTKRTAQFLTKLPLMLVLTFPDKSDVDQVLIDRTINLSSLIEPGSPSDRFQGYMNTFQVDQFTGERIALQALALHFSKAVIASVLRRYSKTLTDSRWIEVNAIVEALALASHTPGLNDALDALLKEQKKAHGGSTAVSGSQVNQGGATGHWSTQQKAQALFSILNSDLKRVFAEKKAQQSRILREKLTLKQQKQSLQRPPFDIEAFSAGSTQFEVVAAVFHTGEDRSGHYTATCWCDTHWRNFADSKISQGDELGKGVGPRPYMLYYQRQPSALQASVTSIGFQEMKGRNNSLFSKQNPEQLIEFFKCLNDELKKHGFQVMIPSLGMPRTISGEFLYRIQQLPWPGAVPGPVGAIIELDKKHQNIHNQTGNAQTQSQGNAAISSQNSPQVAQNLAQGSQTAAVSPVVPGCQNLSQSSAQVISTSQGIPLFLNQSYSHPQISATEHNRLSFALSDAAGVYAVQPAMVPPGIQVSGRTGALLDALFGGPVLLRGSNGQPETFLVEEYNKMEEFNTGNSIDAERELYDEIVSSVLDPGPDQYEAGKPRLSADTTEYSALSVRFLRHWRQYLFSDSSAVGLYASVVNSDLCDSSDPYNRFSLRSDLQHGNDYVLIPTETCLKLKSFYRVFDVEMFASCGNDLYDYGIPDSAQDQENQEWEYHDWEDVGDPGVEVPGIQSGFMSPHHYSDLSSRQTAYQHPGSAFVPEEKTETQPIVPVNLDAEQQSEVLPKRRGRKKMSTQ